MLVFIGHRKLEIKALLLLIQITNYLIFLTFYPSLYIWYHHSRIVANKAFHLAIGEKPWKRVAFS